MHAASRATRGPNAWLPLGQALVGHPEGPRVWTDPCVRTVTKERPVEELDSRGGDERRNKEDRKNHWPEDAPPEEQVQPRGVSERARVCVEAVARRCVGWCGLVWERSSLDLSADGPRDCRSDGPVERPVANPAGFNTVAVLGRDRSLLAMASLRLGGGRFQWCTGELSAAGTACSRRYWCGRSFLALRPGEDCPSV